MQKANIEKLIQKYKLSEKQNNNILKTKILPLVFNNITNNLKIPKAIVLGGQTGARKRKFNSAYKKY